MKWLCSLLLFAATSAAAPVKLEVVGATANADQKRADNVIDGETSDKYENGWSAPGDGNWVKLDLGKPCTVSAVRIAFHRGKGRVHTFEIQTSMDGERFHTVFDGASGGKTNDFERFDFPAAAGRYVRFVGHTIRRGFWASLMEVEAWGVDDGGASASPDDLLYTPPTPWADNPGLALPKGARGRVAGRVSCRVLVRPDGSIQQITPTHAPRGDVAEAITKLISSKWRFEPARRGKVAVSGSHVAAIDMFSDDPKEAEMKALAAQFLEQYNSGNVASLLALLDPEPRRLAGANQVPPSRERAAPWLEDHFAKADRPKFVDIRYETIDLEPFGNLGPLKNQLAQVWCSVRVDGKPETHPRGHFDLLLVKRDNVWRAARMSVPTVVTAEALSDSSSTADEAGVADGSEYASAEAWADGSTTVGNRLTFYGTVEGQPVGRSAVIELLLDAQGNVEVIEVIARSKTADDAMIKSRLLWTLQLIRHSYDGKAKILTTVVTAR